MRKTPEVQSWVVYQTIQGTRAGMKSVCEQSEWEALELSKPGLNTLIQEGLASESEADKLARGTSGDAKRRKS